MFKNKLVGVVLLFLIISIASFLRLYNLKEWPPGLYPDEAMNGTNALQALAHNDFQVFYKDNFGREGLFINIQALTVKLIGKTEPWVLRMPSAIFGILTVLGLYFLAKELIYAENKDGPAQYIALLASFFLATSFWHINFSRIGFRAIMAPLLLTWGFYFLLKAWRQNRYIAAVIGGVIYGLGFYTYLAFRATPLLLLLVAIGYYASHRIPKKVLWKTSLVFICATFITALPIGMYFLQNPADFFGRTGDVSVFKTANPLVTVVENSVKTVGMFFVYGDGNWRHNYAHRPELFWPVALFFAIGIAHGLYKLFKKKQYFTVEIFSLLWLAIAGLPVVLSSEGIPHALRSILMIPAAFILAATGAVWTYNAIKKHSRLSPHILRFYVVAILFLLVVESFSTYTSWAIHPSTAEAFGVNQTAIAREINALPPSTPKYVIVPRGGFILMQTVVFITDTATSEKQKEKNIYYIEEGQTVPDGAYSVHL